MAAWLAAEWSGVWRERRLSTYWVYRLEILEFLNNILNRLNLELICVKKILGKLHLSSLGLKKLQLASFFSLNCTCPSRFKEITSHPKIIQHLTVLKEYLNKIFYLTRVKC